MHDCSVGICYFIQGLAHPPWTRCVLVFPMCFKINAAFTTRHGAIATNCNFKMWMSSRPSAAIFTCTYRLVVRTVIECYPVWDLLFNIRKRPILYIGDLRLTIHAVIFLVLLYRTVYCIHCTRVILEIKSGRGRPGLSRGECHSSRPFCTHQVGVFGLVGRTPGFSARITQFRRLREPPELSKASEPHACGWIQLRILAHAPAEWTYKRRHLSWTTTPGT